MDDYHGEMPDDFLEFNTEAVMELVTEESKRVWNKLIGENRKLKAELGEERRKRRALSAERLELEKGSAELAERIEELEASIDNMEEGKVDWISFSEFKKNLKKRFEEETGWDENRLGDDGLGADLTLHLNYESAYTAWLEIQLAMPQRVRDVPEIEKGEDDGV